MAFGNASQWIEPSFGLKSLPLGSLEILLKLGGAIGVDRCDLSGWLWIGEGFVLG